MQKSRDPLWFPDAEKAETALAERGYLDMQKFRVKSIGLPPGSLVHVGRQKVERPILSALFYSPAHAELHADISLEECLSVGLTKGVLWVDLCGLHDTELLASLGKAFDLHPLAQEDILNTQHRAKFDPFGDCNLMILKMLVFDPENDRLQVEQVSFVQLPRTVLSFQEWPGDVFDSLRLRLQKGNGRIRRRGADYLLYALVDSVVDGYFHALAAMADRLNELEAEVEEQPSRDTLGRLHRLRRQLSQLRAATWPLRDAVLAMRSEDNPLLGQETELFLRDLHDHVMEVLDLVEMLRGDVAALVELYLSGVSHRMNEVMQVLTIMASLFIPLTFIAGVYGMNFENMPELKTSWGYPAVWGIMVCLFVGMLAYFKRKKWF